MNNIPSQPSLDTTNNSPTSTTNATETHTPPTQPPTGTTATHIPPTGARSSAGVVIGAIVLAIVVAVLGFGVAVAYGFSSTGSLSIDRTVSHAVMNLPFTPKTTLYVLEKSALVHTELSSAYMTASMAIKSDSLTELLGGAFDMAITGPVDFVDVENPKMSLNFKLTKEFDVDLMLLDKFMYFKLNKIPAVVYAFVGLTPETINNNPFLNRWVSYDTSGLDTEANKALDESEYKESTNIDEITEEKLMQLNTSMLPYLTLSSDSLDGTAVHRIDMDLDKEEIAEVTDEIEDILDSDAVQFDKEDIESMEKMEISIYIDKSTYYMRKMTIVVSGHAPAELVDTQATMGTSNSAADELIQVAIAVELSRLGESFDIEAPSNPTSFETYMLEVSQYMQDLWQNNSNSFDMSESRDAGLQQSSGETDRMMDMMYDPSM